MSEVVTIKNISFKRDQTYFYGSKSCHICRMMCGVTISLCKHGIETVLANIPKQSIQSCTSLDNKEFAPSFQRDFMTGDVTLKKERIMQMRYTI